MWTRIIIERLVDGGYIVVVTDESETVTKRQVHSRRAFSTMKEVRESLEPVLECEV